MCEFCNKTEADDREVGLPTNYIPCEWISRRKGPGACAEQAALLRVRMVRRRSFVRRSQTRNRKRDGRRFRQNS